MRRLAARALSAATAVLVSVGLAAGPVDAGPGGSWGVTWATAPSAAVGNVTNGYAGFTIRNVVHASIGGSQVRIRLSNRFGTLPLPLRHVTVAISAHAGGRKDGTIDRSDGSARPGTVRDVRFGGVTATTIAAGAEVLSDPVALAVPADHDLLVSTFTPEPSGTVTFHSAARQDSFFANDGVDRSAELSAAAFPQITRVWHYVSGVDVYGAPGTVVALGDSITDGMTATWGANRRWTDYLAHRLAAQSTVPRFGIANAGISGNRILLDDGHPNADLYRTAGRSAQARFGWDVLNQSGVRTVIIFEGINDIQQNPQQTDPAKIIAGLKQLRAQAKARGLRVIGATIMPWQGWGSWTPQLESVRGAVNAWIRTGEGVDGIADFDAATRDPANPQRLLPAYDSGDHLHPNDAGDKAIAAAVPLSRL